jgi:hypothetical protein
MAPSLRPTNSCHAGRLACLYLPPPPKAVVSTRLIERLDERYFDFLERLSSIAWTEGLTGLSLR